HEFVQAAKMFDHIQSRPNKQVIGISKNDLRLEFMQLSRRDGFHRPLRPHRHKRRRLDYAVQCSYSPTSRFRLSILRKKLEHCGVSFAQWLGSARGSQSQAHLLNQGSTNSCVGHSCAHFIMAAPIMSHTVDAIALWRRAQEIDEFAGNEGTNSGTSVRAGFKALRERNLITSDYRWANDADETLRFILTRGSVVWVGYPTALPEFVSTTPPTPGPGKPTTAPLHRYHITLYDQNGNVTERYDVGPSDIVRDDPLRQDIWFRVGGQEKRFHGSYQKERY